MLLSLFLFFLKLGFVSFGGGYPMMSFIMQEGQAAFGLTAQEFADMAALELLASGPIAINAATYIGYIKAGLLGAVVATVGVAGPSLVLGAVVYRFVTAFKDNLHMQSFISFIKVACGGVLVTTALQLAQNILLLHSPNAPAAVSWVGVFIVVLCVVCIKKFKVNPVIMIFVSALIGILFL